MGSNVSISIHFGIVKTYTCSNKEINVNSFKVNNIAKMKSKLDEIDEPKSFNE